MSVSERKPYRLVRGHYSRREGDSVAIRDSATNARTGMKAPPFVHYMARTVENPRSRDEIMLSDREAEALKGRVVPLFRTDVRTGETVRHDPALIIKPRPIDELITLGMAVSGTKSLNDFRAEVLKAGYLSHMRTIPSRKHDILSALRKVQHDLATQAASDAVSEPSRRVTDGDDDEDGPE